MQLGGELIGSDTWIGATGTSLYYTILSLLNEVLNCSLVVCFCFCVFVMLATCHFSVC